MQSFFLSTSRMFRPLHIVIALVGSAVLWSCQPPEYLYIFLIDVNPQSVSHETEGSLVVRFSTDTINDSVIVVPIYRGNIIDMSRRHDGILVHRFVLNPNSQRQSSRVVSAKHQLGLSLRTLKVFKNDSVLYAADYTKSTEQHGDWTEGIVSEKKSPTVAIEARLSIAYDSVVYNFVVANRSKDTCDVTYSTNVAQNLSQTIMPFGGFTLYSPTLYRPQTNKDLGEGISSYIRSISIVRRDPLRTRVYSPTVIQRKDWLYRDPVKIGRSGLLEVEYRYDIQ